MAKLKVLPLFSYFRFGRDMNLIVLSLVLANIGSNIEQRFFPLYVSELGGSPTAIGLLGTVAGLFVVLAAPLGGWATDRYRRVALYAIGPVIGAVGQILMVCAPRWGWLIPGYLVAITTGLFVGPALFGLVSDIGPEETRASRYAYQAAGLGICATIGPVLGGYIYEYFGYRTFMVMHAVLLTLAGLIRSRVRDPREAIRRDLGFRAPGFWVGFRQAVRAMASSQQFRLFFLVTCLVGFGGAAIGSLFSVFMSEVVHVDQASMGVLYSIAGVATIIASIASGVASDRFGKKPVLGVALFGMVVGYVWFLGARTMAVLSAVWLYQGLVGNLPGPALDAVLADITDRESRGTVRSVFNGLQNLAMLPAPLIGGVLWDTVSPAAPFWFAAAVTLIGALVVIVWMKEPRKAPSGVPETATMRIAG